MTKPLVILFHRLGPYHVARLRAAARGGETVCLELSTSTDDYAWDEVACEVPRVKCFENEQSRSVSFSRMRKRIGELLTELNPRCVAINGWWDNGAVAALSWCCRNRVPAIVMSETQATDGERRGFKERVKASIVSCFSAGLVGGKTHGTYLHKLGMIKEQIFRGYDCVDNEFFRSECERLRKSADQLRQELGLPRPFFLASARFIAKKNFLRLVSAYAEYRRTVSDPWELVILGDGEERPKIEELIEREQLGTVVHLPGFLQVNQIPSYYALAEAFIHPSTHEQWGLVINEAMACGLPVLASSECGSTREMIKHGENGLVFDPLDVKSICAALVELHRDPKEALRLGIEGEKTIQLYGPEQFCSGIWNAVEAAERFGAKPLSLGLRGMELVLSMSRKIPGKTVS